MGDTVLEVSGLTKSFGGVVAVNALSFETRRGEILGIMGPNGSGKTTLFNLMTGVLPASSGEVRFHGQSLRGCTTDVIARRGLVRTFQAATVFRQETVHENIRRGALFQSLGRPGWFLRRKALAAARTAALRMVDDLLAFADLGDVATTRAGDLPYGKQKILGLLIALAQRPTQLLLDEPAAGLNPSETRAMGALIGQIRSARGIDIVLVEHDIAMVTTLSDRILALNYGKTIALDVPQKIVSHPEVIEAYLGREGE